MPGFLLCAIDFFTHTKRTPITDPVLNPISVKTPMGPTSPHVPIPALTPVHSSLKRQADIGPVIADASVAGIHIQGSTDGKTWTRPELNLYDFEYEGGVNMEDMEKIIKRYNGIMMDICHEHSTIGTSYSENTENWNLRDMVSEMQYVFDVWNSTDSIAYQDAHDDSQPSHKPWYKEWLSEKNRMKRFIERYKEDALKMECYEGHCSKYD